VATGSNLACTLTASAYAHEGYITLTPSTPSVLTFGCVIYDERVLECLLTRCCSCYNVTAGTAVGGFQSTAVRVIARIYASGGFDTSLYVTDAARPPNTLSSVVSPNGET
jgi:hypothetical protein